MSWTHVSSAFHHQDNVTTYQQFRNDQLVMLALHCYFLLIFCPKESSAIYRRTTHSIPGKELKIENVSQHTMALQSCAYRLYIDDAGVMTSMLACISLSPTCIHTPCDNMIRKLSERYRFADGWVNPLPKLAKHIRKLCCSVAHQVHKIKHGINI